MALGRVCLVGGRARPRETLAVAKSLAFEFSRIREKSVIEPEEWLIQEFFNNGD